jgi:hypothetical protein
MYRRQERIVTNGGPNMAKEIFCHNDVPQQSYQSEEGHFKILLDQLIDSGRETGDTVLIFFHPGMSTSNAQTNLRECVEQHFVVVLGGRVWLTYKVNENGFSQLRAQHVSPTWQQELLRRHQEALKPLHVAQL